MPTTVSCSWCHHPNPTTARWCRACGHAAQRPRLACDCPQCQPAPLLPPAEQAAYDAQAAPCGCSELIACARHRRPC